MGGDKKGETDDAAADLTFPSSYPGLRFMTGLNAEQLVPSTMPKFVGKRPAEAAKDGDGSALKKLKKSRCAAYRKLIGQNVRCKIEGCEEVCQSSYCARSKLCKTHMKALEVDYKGVKSRFCHKCTKFEPVEAFSPDNHTCNAWLQKARVRYSSDRNALRQAKAEKLRKTVRQTGEFSSGASNLVDVRLGDGIANAVRHMTQSSSNNALDLFTDEFAAIHNSAAVHNSEQLRLPGFAVDAVSVDQEPQISAGVSDAVVSAAGVLQQEFPQSFLTRQLNQFSQQQFDDGSHMSHFLDDCNNLEREWTLQQQLEQQRRRWQQQERQQMQQQMSSLMNNIEARRYEQEIRHIRRQLQLQWEQRQLLLKNLQKDQSQGGLQWEQFQ